MKSKVIKYNGIADGVKFTPIYLLLIKEAYKSIGIEVELKQDSESYSVRGIPADSIYSSDYLPFLKTLREAFNLETIKIDFSKAPKADIVGTITAIGCVYHCKFCPSRDMSYHARNSELVKEEVIELCKHNDYFEFFDNNVLANPEFMRIIEVIPKGKTWGALVNIEDLTPSTVAKYRLMYEAGCRKLYFGLESFNIKDLVYFGKPYTGQINSKIWMSYMQTLGFDLMAFVIRGLPNGTYEEFNSMLDYLQEYDIKFSIGLFHKDGQNVMSLPEVSQVYFGRIRELDIEYTEYNLKRFLNLEQDPCNI